MFYGWKNKAKVTGNCSNKAKMGKKVFHSIRNGSLYLPI